MTYTTQGVQRVNVLAYHEDEGKTVILRVGTSEIRLDQTQREELAAYLLKENN